MSDSRTVRGIQRLRNTHRKLSCLVDWQRTSLQTAGQGLALKVLQYEKIHSVMSTDVIELADVWAIQRSDGACLVAQALTIVIQQHLQSDCPAQSGVTRSIDFTHFAGTQA